MKIRTSYVSNSSSSSFICNVCGREESGYDMSYEDVGMKRCENGHIFCESHELLDIETVDSIKDFLKRHYDESWMHEEIIKQWREFFEKPFSSVEEMENAEGTEFVWDEYNDLISDVGCDYHKCPICQFDVLKKDEGLKYLLKKYNLTEKDVLNELKNQFKDYDEFYDYIKDN